MIVSDRPTPKHRIAGPTPSKHHLVEGQTLPQHRAAFLVKTHGGSLNDLLNRRA